MALQNYPLLYMFLVMVIDMLPLVSQFKSLVQLISGDEEGARRTQENFSRRCPVVSQVRSLGEAMAGNTVAARQTQLSFMRNVGDVVDMVPGVSQVKSLGHVVTGDFESAKETQENFSRRCPGISQMRSLVEGWSRGAEAARETQFEFFRNFGFVNNEKYLYHYTDKRGRKAMERIKASRSTKDAAGKGVYFTSIKPDEYKRETNNDTSSSFYNQPGFEGKADCVIRVNFPMNAVRKVEGDRDIYLFEGNYVDLHKYDYDIFDI